MHGQIHLKLQTPQLNCCFILPNLGAGCSFSCMLAHDGKQVKLEGFKGSEELRAEKAGAGVEVGVGDSELDSLCRYLGQSS